MIASGGRPGTRSSPHARGWSGVLGIEPDPANELALTTALGRSATQLVLCGEVEFARQLLDRADAVMLRVGPGPGVLAWVLEARAVSAGALDKASERVELAEPPERRHRAGGGVLAQLQCPYVRHNRPAVLRRNLRPIARHVPDAIGNRVEQMSILARPDRVGVETGRRHPRGFLTLDGPTMNRSLPVSVKSMAGGAVDAISLPAAI